MKPIHDGATHPAEHAKPSFLGAVLWVSVLLCSTTRASGSDDFTYEVGVNGSTITRYSGRAGSLAIPRTLDGLPFIAIRDYAISGFTTLTNITVPDSVTVIGEYAFWDCRGLTSFAVPDHVTGIGTYPFLGCSGLTNLAQDAEARKAEQARVPGFLSRGDLVHLRHLSHP